MVQASRQMGYSGLVILMDEAERLPSLSTKNLEIHMSNLREIIDACGQSSFSNVMILYAVPNLDFLDGRGAIYEALKQRLSTMLNKVEPDKEWINPAGVVIDLEQSPVNPRQLLVEIGNKLYNIYAIAYSWECDQQKVQQLIEESASQAISQRFADTGYKRLFVQTLLEKFNQERFS